MQPYNITDFTPAPQDKLTEEEIKKVNALGIQNPNAFWFWHTPVLQKAFNLGQLGIDLSDAPVVRGIRYGKAPESGISHNYADDKSERGLSLAQEAGCKEIGSTVWFGDRKAYEYRGVKVGTGSDGETIILPLHVENLD